MTDNNEDREVCVWTYWVRPDREDEFRRDVAGMTFPFFRPALLVP